MNKSSKNIGELRGRVMRGDKLGSRLGYPTANLTRSYFKKHPVEDGIYAAWAYWRQKRWPSAVIIGVDGKLEVHLISWQGNLYGEILRAVLVAKIRPLETYKNDTLLRRQIEHDISVISKMLKLENG